MPTSARADVALGALELPTLQTSCVAEARVHARDHGRPVLRVEAAGAGLHLQAARARVEGAVQRLRELPFFKGFSQRVERVRRRLGVERLALLVGF